MKFLYNFIGMPVRSITITKIVVDRRKSSSIVRRRVPMSNKATNGVIRPIVTTRTIVHTVIPEPNSNFIRRYTRVPNVMTFNNRTFVHEDRFVRLRTLKVPVST